jgi:hypothetical protein
VDHADDRHFAHSEFPGHFVKHQFPTVNPFSVTICQKMMIVTEQLHPGGGPAQSARRFVCPSRLRTAAILESGIIRTKGLC